ncbi:MAG: SIMPL domain-containing protein [Vicinamibacterales bacterium]
MSGLLLLLLATAAPALGQTKEAPPEPVVVTGGEGVVQAVPDRAFVTITAESRASNPREAQRRNTELMKPVQDRLRAAGIPADAIRTTYYELQQEWDYVNGRRVSRGYVARNSVEVRVDAIDRLGEILDIAVTAGATSVGEIRFDLKDRAKLEREALRLAVADARARAEAAAAGAGQSIARVVRIEEQGVIAPPQPPIPMVRMATREEAQADVPIAAGRMELRARVTLTAELK